MELCLGANFPSRGKKTDQEINMHLVVAKKSGKPTPCEKPYVAPTK